jgi:hypothetical protein
MFTAVRDQKLRKCKKPALLQAGFLLYLASSWYNYKKLLNITLKVIAGF